MNFQLTEQSGEDDPSQISSEVRLDDLTRYGRIADEYYDRVAHPTCANFRMASEMGLRHLKDSLLNVSRIKKICETGAGRTIVPEIFSSEDLESFEKILITDSSKRMLDHTKRRIREIGYKGENIETVEADAYTLESTISGFGPFDLIISSLGDPYNDASFWANVKSLLTENGVCLYTTPSSKWAEAYREEYQATLKTADFLTKNGETWQVPSLVRHFDEQNKLIERSSLELIDYVPIRFSDIDDEHLSPKICLNLPSLTPIVEVYAVRKSAESISKEWQAA